MGYYYTSTNNWVTLTQTPVTQCTLPAYNVGSSTTSPGACTGNCTFNALSCLAGKYLANCGGQLAGTCQTCLNTPTSSQEWTSNGGTNPNGCGYSSCLITCQAGQYITSCTSTPPNPTCAPCSNSQTVNSQTVNFTYFTPGPTYTSTCPLTNCAPNCNNGQYLFGCGPTNGNPSSCVSCTN